MRKESKIIEIPSGVTKTQVEQQLNNMLNAGWELVGVFPFISKTWAVFVRTIRVI